LYLIELNRPANKPFHKIAIPLCSIAAGELDITKCSDLH
jgi:hypothetical protein